MSEAEELVMEDQFRELLKALFAMSPAYNRITQMFFIMPQKALTLIKLYPELMEKEEALREVVGIEYTTEGIIRPKGMGAFLHGLFHELFKQLLHPDKRRKLLALANITEKEFKEMDPLREWLDISLDFMARFNKDALKLLDIIVTKLTGKKPDEYVEWSEVLEAATNIKDPEEVRELLRHFFLLSYEYSSWIYARECPLCLDVYSDLRRKLRELLE